MRVNKLKRAKETMNRLLPEEDWTYAFNIDRNGTNTIVTASGYSPWMPYGYAGRIKGK